MKKITSRYAEITQKFPREFILLQGRGCFWKNCNFCDYYEDTSSDPFTINKPIIEKITGKYGVLEVINSGSIMEMDKESLNLIIQKINDLKINEVWFEAHWAYHKRLDKFAKKFKNTSVKFRTGIESFNPDLRNFWNKGIPYDVTPQEIAKYFSSVNILVGTDMQTIDDIKNDIEIAQKYFERFMVNVFVENDSKMCPNFELIERFLKKIYPNIKDKKNIEISIKNTDLGVG